MGKFQISHVAEAVEISSNTHHGRTESRGKHFHRLVVESLLHDERRNHELVFLRDSVVRFQFVNRTEFAAQHRAFDTIASSCRLPSSPRCEKVLKE